MPHHICLKLNYLRRLQSFQSAYRRLAVILLLLLAWSLLVPRPVEIADSLPADSALAPQPLREGILTFVSCPLDFEATAYCDYGITKSGVLVEPGIVAADPSVIPLGSLIHVDVPGHSGIYRVMDTGLLVKGKIIDIYMPSEEMALAFGRRKVKVTVLRCGYPKRRMSPATEAE